MNHKAHAAHNLTTDAEQKRYDQQGKQELERPGAQMSTESCASATLIGGVGR